MDTISDSLKNRLKISTFCCVYFKMFIQYMDFISCMLVTPGRPSLINLKGID